MSLKTSRHVTLQEPAGPLSICGNPFSFHRAGAKRFCPCLSTLCTHRVDGSACRGEEGKREWVVICCVWRRGIVPSPSSPNLSIMDTIYRLSLRPVLIRPLAPAATPGKCLMYGDQRRNCPSGWQLHKRPRRIVQWSRQQKRNFTRMAPGPCSQNDWIRQNGASLFSALWIARRRRKYPFPHVTTPRCKEPRITQARPCVYVSLSPGDRSGRGRELNNFYLSPFGSLRYKESCVWVLLARRSPL